MEPSEELQILNAVQLVVTTNKLVVDAQSDYDAIQQSVQDSRDNLERARQDASAAATALASLIQTLST